MSPSSTEVEYPSHGRASPLRPSRTLAPRTHIKTTDRLIWKTIVVSALVIGTNVVGNYGLSRGLREIGVIESWSPLPYVRAFAHPWVVIGVFFMIAWLVTRLALLSWADLTYVLPVTSFSYVLSAVAGAVLLHERVSFHHWVGICVITIGVGLVGFTYPKTTDGPEHKT